MLTNVNAAGLTNLSFRALNIGGVPSASTTNSGASAVSIIGHDLSHRVTVSISGVGTAAGGLVDVVFGTPLPDTNYNVQITGDFNVAGESSLALGLAVYQKTTNGYSIFGHNFPSGPSLTYSFECNVFPR